MMVGAFGASAFGLRGGILLGKHGPERASGPPHRTGLPEAIYRKASTFTSSLTNQSMICEQFLGVGSEPHGR